MGLMDLPQLLEKWSPVKQEIVRYLLRQQDGFFRTFQPFQQNLYML